MIVQTATVIESCMHYTLKEYIEKGKIKSSDAMENEWRDEKCVVLEEFDNGTRQVCGVVRHKASANLTRHTKFQNVNRACKRSGIVTDDVFTKAEKLRESRNKIHLAGLTSVDDLYTKEDVDEHFNYAKDILEEIEMKLNELKSS